MYRYPQQQYSTAADCVSRSAVIYITWYVCYSAYIYSIRIIYMYVLLLIHSKIRMLYNCALILILLSQLFL